MPLNSNDELNLDRAIDMPVYQDVLAWDVFELGTWNWLLVVFSCPNWSDTSCVCADEVRCGLIADGQTCLQLFTCESAAAVPLVDFGRLLVVLSKDRYLCCFCDTGTRVLNL